MYDRLLLSYKNKMKFSGKWMKQKITILSEVTQAQNDKGHMLSLIIYLSVNVLDFCV